MKIELVKETDKRNKTYFWVYVDGKGYECFVNEQDARLKFEEITKNGLPTETKEVLESVEV